MNINIFKVYIEIDKIRLQQFSFNINNSTEKQKSFFLRCIINYFSCSKKSELLVF